MTADRHRARPAPARRRAAARRTSRSSRQRVRGKPLVYLDNAATSQKPQRGHRRGHAVLRGRERQHPPRRPLPERARHRGLRRGARAGRAVPQRRVARARSSSPAARPRAINLVAQSWGRGALRRRATRSSITGMEHHSNIVPWQLVAEQTGAVLRAVPITDAGELDLDGVRPAAERPDPPARRDARLERARHHQPGARLVALAPWRAASPVLVDGAQSAPHLPVDVQELGLRLLRLLGPQGVRAHRRRACSTGAASAARADAALAGRRRHDRERSRSSAPPGRPPPARFEAGTPHDRRGHRAGRGARLRRARGPRGHRRLGGGAAGLRHRAGRRAARRPTHRHRAATRPRVLSFVVDGVHPHDVGDRARRRGHRDPGRAPLRPAASCGASACPPPRGPRSPSTTRATRSTRWCAASRRVRDGVRLMSSLSELYQNVILEHNRSPRNYRAMADADRPGRGPQSALRRPGDASGSGWTAT